MDLKQLECFVRVAEFGSFTKAAAVLNISQSVVSRQVRQLEVELQEHLLLRHGRGVLLTASGQRLFDHGKGILRQVQVAREELREQRDTLSGKVVIGLPPSISRCHTVDLVSAFRERFPGCALGIKEGLSHSMREWLLLGRLDFALLFNPAHSAPLHYEHIHSEPLMLIGAASSNLPDTVAMQDLGSYPLIIPSEPHSLRRLIETQAARHAIILDVCLEIDSIPSLLDLIDLGMGYGVLFQSALVGRGNLPEGLKAAQIVDPPIPTHLFIATSEQRPLSRLAEKTLAMVREICMP
ncbi:LysR family transcriptional regulator, nitrogen assimilation regulatory protein [Azotobacter beijerinckii]|uniref:LysR family transcriptional regulator, nitrogen assimilation regulatory protein n=1 Tax=Azotobacter beijerinckii TaxID=170623 RepID=A0A1H6YGK0_9GAMM|nr:LysR substrate-binding domain-containing protein [Azotobacter beijerinckii]SEJ40379.1 LysR family transcriptional regulator, nitrogen assimilation regulatory protein [Azotobacter beijerinckii]